MFSRKNILSCYLKSLVLETHKSILKVYLQKTESLAFEKRLKLVFVVFIQKWLIQKEVMICKMVLVDLSVACSTENINLFFMCLGFVCFTACNSNQSNKQFYNTNKYNGHVLQNGELSAPRCLHSFSYVRTLWPQVFTSYRM